MLRISLATVLVGLCSGLAGSLVAILLHATQHLAYGFNPVGFIGDVLDVSSRHRFWVLLSCGVLGGFGWFLLQRYAKPLFSLSSVLQEPSKKLSFLSTCFSDFLQVIAAGLGSPLGREVAPRELGALFAQRIGLHFTLQEEELRTLIACGAGAGFGAVYNVPLSGALFSIEVILKRRDFKTTLYALSTSFIAVATSWFFLENQPQYRYTDFRLSASLIVWSLCAWPILKAAGTYFGNFANQMRSNAYTDWKLVLACIVNFGVIGLLSMSFPEILGNGKNISGLEFAGIVSLKMGLVYLALRILITLTSVRVGAMGGLLTPSIAIGSLLGGVLGWAWCLAWPGSTNASFAIVGAALFLGAAQKMPLTAIILLFELTH